MPKEQTSLISLTPPGFIPAALAGDRDSIDVLNQGPEGWVDLCFADPPFNIGYLYHNYDDEKDVDEIYAIVDFEIAVGLPVTFADLNLEGVGRDRLKMIGDICAGKGSLCENHPFRVTSDDVVDAMIAADALGQEMVDLLADPLQPLVGQRLDARSIGSPR